MYQFKCRGYQLNEFTVGRTPLVLVQIDQDFCNLTYGVAPCNAVNPNNKCFNTYATCQVQEVYDKGVKTITFGKPESDLPRDMNILPMLTNVTTAPTKINPTNGNSNISPLGQRAVATITFLDAPYSDLLVDKYRGDRSYIPLQNGTFWSKWLVRNPYYQNRPLRIYEGYLGQDIEDMQVRHYLIDTITGPDSNGKVSIVAKDPLKLADRQKSQAPVLTIGELNADIDATQTTITIIKAQLSDYPTSGTLRIDDELITYTGRTNIGTVDDVIIEFTGIVRGTDGSLANLHSEDANVQLCLRYTDEYVWDVVYDLLTTYAKIPASYIPYADWEEEGLVWLPQFNVTTLITEPTGVDDLLYELMEQVLFYIWWDERDQEIKLRAIRPIIGEAPMFSDDANIIENSASFSTDPKNRVSQVWVYWNQRNRAEEVDKSSNYQQIELRSDLDAESDNQYGESRIRKVYARWIQNNAQAVNLAARLLGASFNNPKYMKIRVDAKDRATWTADIVDIYNRNIVNFNGEQELERYQILSVQEVVSGEVIEYEMQKFLFRGTRFAFYMEDDAPLYVDATPEEIEGQSAWYADNEGLMADGSQGWEYQ
jgi:hypothetical protein